MKRILAALVVIDLAGCTHTYVVDQVEVAQPLERKGGAYVMLAADGGFAGQTYPKSGLSLSQEMATAISKRLDKIETATAMEDINDALTKANSRSLRYVVQPSIMHWEDRATEWSAKPDRITVRIVVWDAATRREAASTTASATSKWGTFGGDHPEDLLPETAATFVNRAFQ